MSDVEEAHRQKEQLERYLSWIEESGGVDGHTHLDTLLRPEQQERLSWLKHHCKGTIMEIGCCYGYILAHCGGNIGVDINPKLVSLAQILNPRKIFVQADARSLPFPDNFVDTVMMPDILEHLPWSSVPQALAEALRVAHKKVLITMPNAEYITQTATLFKHQFLLTQQKFTALLEMLVPHKVHQERNFYWALIEVLKGA